MKLTWFAGTTLRVHIGGEIVVADAGLAPSWVDGRELLSGADRSFGLAEDDGKIDVVNAESWRRRRPQRPLEQGEAQPLDILRFAPGAVLVDAPGEPLLVLLASGEPPRFGRWAQDAVVVLFGAGPAIVALGTVLLDIAEPKLLALAADEPAVELAVAELGEHLDGTGLVSLEPGMAVEV